MTTHTYTDSGHNMLVGKLLIEKWVTQYQR